MISEFNCHFVESEFVDFSRLTLVSAFGLCETLGDNDDVVTLWVEVSE